MLTQAQHAHITRVLDIDACYLSHAMARDLLTAHDELAHLYEVTLGQLAAATREIANLKYGDETGPAPEEGDKCKIGECSGVYGYARVEDCSCHIRPPCSQCVENPMICLVCGADPFADKTPKEPEIAG